MKRLLVCLLTLALLLPLCACKAKLPEKTEEPEVEKEDLSVLDAAVLYETAVQKTHAKKSVLYKTAIGCEGEESTLTSLRIREGYEGFAYSRTGEGETLVICDGSIYASTQMGAFRAEVTTRTAREYLSAYWFPLTCLDPALLGDWEKDGLKVSYRLKNEAVLALYADAAADFVPEGAVGEATVSEAGIIETEHITVTGKKGDAAATLTLVSTRLDTEATSILPPKGDYTFVGDIRIPHLFLSAVRAMEGLETVSTTRMCSGSLGIGENAVSFGLVDHFYQVSPEHFYRSVETISKAPETENQRSFSQLLLKDGKYRKALYDLATAELLSEEEGESCPSPWREILEEALPALTLLSDFSYSESGAGGSVSFTLSEAGKKEICAYLAEMLPQYEEKITVSDSAVCEGVFTVDGETGLLTVFSLSVEASDLSCRISLNLDGTEDVTLPEWQTPTAPTEGGEEGAHEH
ncbi:MAG: hypothetical protein IKC69_05660 [Clostridia bacterium]|nr:hypothetical protein [Clostridia bacterium]